MVWKETLCCCSKRDQRIRMWREIICMKEEPLCSFKEEICVVPFCVLWEYAAVERQPSKSPAL